MFVPVVKEGHDVLVEAAVPPEEVNAVFVAEVGVCVEKADGKENEVVVVVPNNPGCAVVEVVAGLSLL